MKGLPSGYNKDLQEDKQAVFDAEDTLAGCLAVVESVVGGLTLNRERAAAAASGLLLATDVADYLVGARRAVPARARNRRRARRASCSPKGGISSRSVCEEWRAASELVRGRTSSTRVTPRRLGGGEAHAAIDRAGGGRRWRGHVGWTGCGDG